MGILKGILSGYFEGGYSMGIVYAVLNGYLKLGILHGDFK